MRKILLFLVMLFSLGSSAMAATLSGTIKDGIGPIEGATVSVTVAGDTEPVGTVITDTYSFWNKSN